MDYNEEIKKQLEFLKTAGHDRRKVELALGYKPKGIDQSLARKTGKDNEKLYRQVLLYRNWATLKDSIPGAEGRGQDLKDGTLKLLAAAIEANKEHAQANRENAEANKKHADSINRLVNIIAKNKSDQAQRAKTNTKSSGTRKIR